jgi:thiosulfate/3-mercaptopyruvate sulfurtransferase
VNNQDILISAGQLSERSADADLRILDCRFNLLDPAAGRAGYLAGHIPGAVYADLNQDLAAPVSKMSGRHPLPDIQALATTFGELGIGANNDVVVYDDQGGAIAARAWWLLRWLGHSRVALLDGGLQAWTSGKSPIEAGAVLVTPQVFVPAIRDGWFIETQEIMSSIGRGEALVDARAADRFQGRLEPIDTVAGHIPGAVNLPFDRSLGPDGRWKPVAELREMWAGILPNGTNKPWSVMCGSGVTACHLAISASVAGLAQPRLYAGSWSEWIRDDQRPVATGVP